MLSNNKKSNTFLDKLLELTDKKKNLLIWRDNAFVNHIENFESYRIIRNSQEYKTETSFDDYDNIVILAELDWEIEAESGRVVNYADFVGLRLLEKLKIKEACRQPNYIIGTFLHERLMRGDSNVTYTLPLADQLIHSNGFLNLSVNYAAILSKN